MANETSYCASGEKRAHGREKERWELKKSKKEKKTWREAEGKGFQKVETVVTERPTWGEAERRRRDNRERNGRKRQWVKLGSTNW